jgi:hypothetical protein
VPTPETRRPAKEAGIPVSTIALGTLTGTVTTDRNGSQVIVLVPRPDDARQHRRVDGRPSPDVTDAEKLDPCTTGSQGRRHDLRREVTAGFVAVAAALHPGDRHRCTRTASS